MLEQMQRSSANVRHAKPPSSRKEASKLYVVATGFRPRVAISASRRSHRTSPGNSRARSCCGPTRKRITGRRSHETEVGGAKRVGRDIK